MNDIYGLAMIISHDVPGVVRHCISCFKEQFSKDERSEIIPRGYHRLLSPSARLAVVGSRGEPRGLRALGAAFATSAATPVGRHYYR